MKNRILILSVFMATLFACNSDSMISDDFNKPGGERAFKIKNLNGDYTLGQTSEPCGPATLTAIGQGTVSHLGKSTLLEEWCFNGNSGDLGTRTITITAANGDELYGYHTTILWTSETTFEETLIIDGGSGRFENASGTVKESVEIFPNSEFTGTFTLNAEGTINY